MSGSRRSSSASNTTAATAGLSEITIPIRPPENGEHQCAIGAEIITQCPPIRQNANCAERLRERIRASILLSEKHPRSKEYYNSPAQLTEERWKQYRSHPFIIHPFSTFRMYYELYASIVYILSLVFRPLNSAFDTSFEDIAWLLYFNYILDIGCYVDVVMTFFTGYVVTRKKMVVMEPSRIARMYILSWDFWFDVISSLPTYLVKEHWTEPAAWILLRLVGFLKVNRIVTVMAYLDNVAMYFRCQNLLFSTFNVSLMIFFVNHWLACLIYFVPFSGIATQLLSPAKIEKSWISRENIVNANMWTMYTRSFFRASQYLLCVFPHPEELMLPIEQLVAVLSFFFGTIWFFYMWAKILMLLLTSSTRTKYHEKYTQLEEFMRQKELPISLQRKVLDYFDFKYQKRFFEEKFVMSLISDNLKTKIRLHCCQRLLQQVDLFADLPQNVIENIVNNLVYDISLPNDVLVMSGTRADCMYFLLSGEVTVLTSTGKEVCHLHDGAFFGEISLLVKEKKRTATIAAVEYCEIYRLDRSAFKLCFERNPHLLARMRDVAHQRLEDIIMIEEINRLHA